MIDNISRTTAMAEQISVLSDAEMQKLYNAVILELQLRTTRVKPKSVLLCTDDYMVRRHGGWTKVVTGLDKQGTLGYSIEGYFVPSEVKSYYQVGALYLDCDKGGSWKRPITTYTLFTVEEKEGNPMIVLFETDSVSWARDLWKPIESYWAANPAFAPVPKR
ncbi:MAG: hypothetical protein EOO61_01795 [Hymenobacter sp.]|nr:MAG: hypothetical protein EOO61_01795 [Hymenobacter sp.]